MVFSEAIVNAIRLVVSSQDIDSTTVEWDVVGDGGRPYKVRVLRCESRFGPFEPISDYFDQSKRSFIDPTPTQKLLRHFYYKLEITYDDETIEYYPKRYGASDERQDDKEARMLAGDSEILYRMHGQKVIYFPVRTHGRRCPHCFDAVTGKRLIKNCPSCYSTTYAGGFLNPVQIDIMIENAQVIGGNSDDPSRGVGVSAKTASGRFPWFVDIKENDVIVDAQNTRWRISEPIREITKRRCRIYQTCILAQLSFDCIEYTLPVPNPIDTWQHGWRYTPEMARGITDDEPGHTPPLTPQPGTSFYGGIGTTRMGDPITIDHGGTGQITKQEAFEALSPIDALGDLLYGGAGGIDTILSGNRSTIRKFLSQTGTGLISAAPIWEQIDWNDIANTPTTLDGFGITDAVKNGGGAPEIVEATLVNRPDAGTEGRLFVATDINRIYRDTGSTWNQLRGATLTRSTGLTGGNYDGSADSTWSVDFAGTGSAPTVARSDHNHSTTYAPLIHEHDWEDLTSGVPTTVAGYGITDAVSNRGSTPSIQSGTLANRPAAGTVGRLYLTTDTKIWYRDTGVTWVQIGGNDELPNPVDIPHGGTGETTKTEAFDALSPTSALGDLIYGGAAGTGLRLPGNTTIVKKFLTSAGTGAVANAPAWDIIEEEDLDGILIDGGDWE